MNEFIMGFIVGWFLTLCWVHFRIIPKLRKPHTFSASDDVYFNIDREGNNAIR